MSSSGLKWDSAPSSVDNNDAGSWLPIQSKKKQSKPTQPIPDGARQSNSLPYKKKNGDNLGSGTMASGSRRPAIPVVSKFTPPVKKAVSAIPQKNVGVQARPVVKKALPISSTATTIPELSETPKSVKITPSTKAGKETAKSLKDETGIYDLMMFVRASSDNNKVGTNTTKSVHSRDGKPVLGSQASTKKPIEVNEEFVKHRFLQGKPKKKIFSKIKKRILMERLQSQMKRLAISNLAINKIQQTDAIDFPIESRNLIGRDYLAAHGTDMSELPCARREARTVSLSQFVTEEDISDESEYEEIIADIKKMFSPFGDLESIIIRVQSGQDVCSDIVARDDRILGTRADEHEQQCLVFVTFSSCSAAGAAATAINGSLSGGLPIVAGLCATDAAGGGYEDMQRGIPLINNLKIELISSDKDDDANSEVIGVSQSDILTNSKTPSEHDTPHILRAGEAYEHDLYLENAVFRDDVADEDEIAEVLSDLRSLCEVFGHISAVWIEKINKIPLQTVETGLLSYADFTFGEPAVSPSLWVFIEYDTVQEAAVAVAALNGLCIGGKAISARMYSYSAYSAGKCSDTHCWDIDYLSLLGVNSDGMIGVHSTVEGAVVALLDYVTVDDYEGCSGDSEELGTIKRDLIDLVTAQSSSGHREISESAFIRRVTIMAPTGGDDETHPAGDEPALGSERLAACVRYSSIGDSTAAMLSLDGTILGGSRLKAWVKRSSNAPQSVSPQDSAFDAVEGEVLEGSGNVFANQLIALRTFETTRPTLEGQSGTPIAGSSLDPQAPLTPPISAGSNTRKIASNSGESVDEEAVFSVQPAYKEARLAPKLEKNSILDSRHRIKVADGEIEALVKDFLGSIATFQEKLKERDPLKAAAKRRFVMGIKQATNCVKAGLVKLLLLAPDSEASEALDCALDTLLDQAEQNEVAALYCLNRRKLGKAVHSSMKQVVVAVIDADGAYENYKKIIAFINKPSDDCK